MGVAMKTDAVVVTVLVLAHLVVAGMHGGAHEDLGIVMAAWQNAFINLVIVGLPLVGAGLLWTRRAEFGLGAVIAGMVGALIFGVYHHYMASSPDHISHLPEAAPHVHETFIWTAGTIAIFEGVCAAAAAYFLGQRLRSVR